MNAANLIKNELYRFAGIHCVKYSNDEYIFDFVVQNEGSENETYTIQILREGYNKAKLGLLALPKFIDFKQILSETPVDNVGHVKLFVRNCRQHINCRQERMQQFTKLTSICKDSVNCSFEANYNYNLIYLHFLDVYDVESDANYNCIVYLLYKPKEARPYEIKIDSLAKKQFKTEITERLTSYFNYFQTLTLHEAFTRINNKTKAGVSWKMRKREDEIKINESDESDEETFLKDYGPDKTAKKKKLQAKGVKKKKSSKKAVSESEETNSDTEKKRLANVHKKINELDTKLKRKILTRSLKKANSNDNDTSNISEDKKSNSDTELPEKRNKINESSMKLKEKVKNKASPALNSKQTKLTFEPTTKIAKNKIGSNIVTSTPLQTRNILEKTSTENFNVSKISPRKSIISKKLKYIKTKK